MIKEPEIRIGLITEGPPQIEELSNGEILLRNLRIGDGFHWQKPIIARLHGKIEFLETPQGNIYCINRVQLEEYLKSVTGSEMNGDAPIEFLKAHAVISRSWAIRKLLPTVETSESNQTDTISWEESDTHSGFEVCSDDHCQRYQGIQNNETGVVRAITETRGEVLKDAGGKVADARFSKCCGGRTEIFSTCWADKDYDYLQSFEDNYCNLSDMSEKERNEFLGKVLKSYDQTTTGFHDWHVRLNRKDLEIRLKDKLKTDFGDLLDLQKETLGQSGRIKKLRIKGSKANIIIGKELAIRRLLTERCLYSSWFDIRPTEMDFLLDGHGWGHGVGLCQIGAARMAWDGKNYQEILNYYYPDTKIEKIYG